MTIRPTPCRPRPERRGPDRRGRAAGALLALGLALAGGAAAEVPAPEAATATAEEAGREFRAICEALRRTANPFYGEAQVGEIRQRLAAGGLPVERRVALQRQLAEHLLRLGQQEQAVGLLNETLRLAGDGGLPKEEQIAILARLGVAAMRLGEVRNCIGMHGPAMCILPIGPEGRHRDPQGSDLAIRAFEAVLDGIPDYPTVPWLLNIAAMTVGRYPDGVGERYRIPPHRMRSSFDVGRFPDVAAAVGLTISDVAGGAVMDDFDGDGLLDVVTSSAEPCAPMRFFRNDGSGGFEDRSAAPELAAQLGALNLAQADYDNDGDLDLLVLRGGWLGEEGRIRNSLLANDGSGRFTDVTARAGLAEPAYPTQTGAWADYDLDGDLDLYVGNEGRTVAEGFASQLFRNNGDGTFTDVAAAAGVENRRYAKAVAWGDVDNDGDPDLYVSNYGPNRLYRNNGDGTFSDLAPAWGMTEPALQSFGSFFFDYDQDGWLDLFVARYEAGPDTIADYFLAGRESSHPMLYRNLAGKGFREVSEATGLTQPSAPMGHNWGDLDNDGYPDVYLGTGWPQFEALMPNLMYRNDGGRRFLDVTYSGGFGHLQKGHGVAWGDFDNDGDQDLFEQMGGAYPGDAYPSALYLNPGHGNSWLTLRLEGVRANRKGVGARIEVRVRTAAGPRTVHHLVGSGGSFGGSSLQAEIGLGAASAIEEVVIRWPAGPQQGLGALALDSVYEVREGSPPRKLSPPRIVVDEAASAEHHHE